MIMIIILEININGFLFIVNHFFYCQYPKNSVYLIENDNQSRFVIKGADHDGADGIV
ncbi:hypothetical protein QNH39_23600 [Neobacillus novalis]|uniref:Uncharacterized protein n=1 Tax=Neobacillus novalis TaxID=220687 RepID=A0AA95MKW2_9BACI|nr:hypothetical protein [Neobacillus novalis]WHY85561.1 hypothetical protein QNH39_23600 [Neobacillus novalis]